MMANKKPDFSPRLRADARALGIATGYESFAGEQIKTSEDVLRSMIARLGKGQSAILRQRKTAARDAIIAPVIVAWGGEFKSLWIWHKDEKPKIKISLLSETDAANLDLNVKQLASYKRQDGYYRIKLAIEQEIPFGYYKLNLHDGSSSAESLLISAPVKIKQSRKQWGIFAPLYALQSKKNTEIGGYRELAQACFTVKQLGGDFLGTLPLLASHYEGEHKNISPYSPSTRLFLNEIYLDAGEAEDDEDLVDYDSVFSRKKRILETEAQEFFKNNPQGDASYQAFKETAPYLEEYAAFRAAEGNSKEYHLYCQYKCHQQLSALREKSVNGETAELYLDFPVGLDPKGFDGHQFSDMFLNDFQVGAPPDMMFSGGQNWGFAPLNPDGLIKDNFSYFRLCLSQYFRYARMVRLDHVMGLYRIYVVPEGEPADKGTYIYYPFNAILAILCLEAHLHGGVLIGENLGTVPDAVQTAMDDHDIMRMWIYQFHLEKDFKKSFESIEPDMIACINTHDMFPLKSFLLGKDFEKLTELKLLDQKSADKGWRERQETMKAWKDDNIFQTIVTGMAKSEANYVLIGLEDILQETEPQNIPGTVDNNPNWRKKIKLPIEKWDKDHRLKDTADILNKFRPDNNTETHTDLKS